MALSKVTFKPGINRESTQYAAGPGYYDCDKIRFRQGRPQKIGGWQKYAVATIKGIARSIFSWNTAASEAYLGIGTSRKFYVEIGGTYSDITPIRLTTAAGDATFDATDGSSVITVTEASHGAGIGDYVTFSGAASLGGTITAAVLNHEYAIATIVDGNSFTISATDAAGTAVVANASDTGAGGAAAVAAYQIQVGTNSYVASTGWGVGGWGESSWGGGGTMAFAGQLRLYSQDQFGDDLIFNPRVGAVYYWDESGGVNTRAINLSALSTASNVPTVALQVMVSSLDRHVICFGVNPLGSGTLDPLLVRWSDQEDAGDWTPTAINSSGGQVLSSGKSIVGVVKARQEFLIFTETSIHSMRYVGAPYVYQFSVVSENISMVGPKAGVSIGSSVFFMGQNGFYLYEGAVQPIPCTVLNYVFAAIDKTQLYKVHACSNIRNSEITWFYPADDTEINRYVTYNYAEQIWTIGAMARGAWIEAEGRQYPIASGIDTVNIDSNYLYRQEIGYDAETSAMGEYIESGPVELNDGDSFSFLRRVIPDFRFDGEDGNASITMTIKGNDYPLETPATKATATITSSTTQSNVRVRAREVILRLTGTGAGYGWTMGDFRFDVRTDGRR